MSKAFGGLMVFLMLSGPALAEHEKNIPVARFAQLALDCVHQEYPNKISHVMDSDDDLSAPRLLTPVFFGCFDWHSSVHGHWLLVRLLRLYPQAEFAADAEAALSRSFTATAVDAEVAYMTHSGRKAFERPYGIAWFLQLMAELREWNDPRAEQWRNLLGPLENAYVRRVSEWLPNLAYPIRTGEHAQTAFAFALFLDWAKVANDLDFGALVEKSARLFYLDDRRCPLNYEPGGQDFLSPCLAEADLMRRILDSSEFSLWLEEFLPLLGEAAGADWLPLATVTDRSDGKLAHLDGLHLSRAWALVGIASALSPQDARRAALLSAAWRQGNAGLAAVTGEFYEGGHWLGSFATYLVTGRGTGLPFDSARSGQMIAAAPEPRLTMLSRIGRWEPSLNALISLDGSAFDGAAPSESAGTAHARLRGLPVLVKDNIDIQGWPTTAGSLALLENVASRDADVVARLREAGLIIAGKTNLSEWANFRDDHSTSGWSGVGGLTRNAWSPGRSACGSSSGSAVAVAAAYVPFAIGTETNGSIVCPAAYNGIVGVKPTLGLVSQRGIIPIAATQDTAGPMAYDVRTAAMLLEVMSGQPEGALTRGLSPAGLQGLRVGVIRSRDYGKGPRRLYDIAINDLRKAGAVLIEDLKFPDWPEGFWDDSLNVLLYEFKAGLNQYLAGSPPEVKTRSLADLIEFNEVEAEREMRWFGQSLLTQAQKKKGLEQAEYRHALKRVREFTRQSIDGLMASGDLDVLVMPTNALPFVIDEIHGDSFHGGSSTMAAISGYPHVTVPAGKSEGLPVGLSFMGAAGSDALVLQAAFAYERATMHATTLEGRDPWHLEQRFSEQSGN